MTERTPAPSTYYNVFAGLIGLTLLTVALSFIHLGAWHTPIGLAIAITKASLVAIFFMHLAASSRMVWISLGAGLFWLGILLGLTMTDYLSRGRLTF
jgi:cytochrome c oxidase subunit 4